MNLEIAAIIALALASIPAVMFLWNLPQLRPPSRPPDHAAQQVSTAISVLIPARNEATNIPAALESILANRGLEFEVVVLDDQSTDDTAALVRVVASRDARVRLESAPPLPRGWCGKQHACYHLAQHARHPLLLFMDADVRLGPESLQRLSHFMSVQATGNENHRHSSAMAAPALASGVPHQITGTLLEKLLIPLIHFVLLGFLPLWRMRRCTKPAYGAGCGQLFIARADAYRAVGGHAAIHDSLHDGLKLPRAFRRAGYRTDLFDATTVASCRMYQGAQEVIAGLTKNAHEGLATPAQIGPWTLLLLGGQVLPWLLLAATPWLNAEAFWLTLAAAAISLVPRVLAAVRFQQSWLGVLLHPVAVTMFLCLQWVALVRSLRRKPQSWKGRHYGTEPAQSCSATANVVWPDAQASLPFPAPKRGE
jgi:hypothetical protein